MAERTCEDCGSEFRREVSRKRCNSCDYAQRPRVPCSVCGEPTGIPMAARCEGFAHRCNACRRSPCGTVASYHRGCRCDECRAAATARMREYAAKRRAEGRPVGYDRSDRVRVGHTCAECAAPIRSWAGRAADGLILCARHRAEKHNRDRSARRRRARVRAELRKAAAGSRGSRWPWVQGVCAYCGERFTRRGQSSAYCSGYCRRKGKPSSGFISKRDRLAIYERDDWTCQLCNEPVDRDAHHQDDWAPSLDHIECQSWALIPDHSLENLRCCHRWCNSVRGDGAYHADFFEEAS